MSAGLAFQKEHEHDGYVDYASSITLTEGVVVDIHIALTPEGGAYMTIGVGDDEKCGDPIEYPLTRAHADLIIAGK